MPGEGQAINVLGDRQTIKLSGTQTDGTLAVIEQNNIPGPAVPMHVHTRENETFYVSEGEVTFFLAGKEVVATAGTTIFLPRGVPHGFRVNKPTRAILFLQPAGGEAMFRKLSELPPGPPDMEKAIAICAEYGVYFT